MEKILIFNFNWEKSNYGAKLTAFALQYILSKLNLESKLVNNMPIIHKLANNKAITLEKFQNKYLNQSNLLRIYEEFNNLNFHVKNFITGSDQVFRPLYIQNQLWQYLLDFVNPDKKKIAFSVSFGVDKKQFLKETSQKNIDHMKKSLKSFDFISVREKSGVEICKDIFDVDAEWIIDPVFILEKSSYEDLIQNSTNEYSNKIVSYVLDSNKNYKKAYKYFYKKYNSKVIELANSNESIENWLASIKNCRFLITDSFHGMCFAIIFNKPFICITNQNRGATRFESILEMLNIKNTCINSIDEIYEKNCVFKIDYEKVNKRIEEERQRGLDFLKIALDAPISKQADKIKAKLKFLEEKVCELEKQATLKYQLKRELWNLWLVIFHKYLPKPIKAIIRNLKQKGEK